MSDNHDSDNKLDQFILKESRDVPKAPDYLKHQIRSAILNAEEKKGFFGFFNFKYMIPGVLIVLIGLIWILNTPQRLNVAKVSDAELEDYLNDTFYGVMDSIDDDDSDLFEVSLR